MGFINAAALLASGLVASVQARSMNAAHANLHKRHGDYDAKPFEVADPSVVCKVEVYTTYWEGEATMSYAPIPAPTTISTTSTSTLNSTTHAVPTTTSTSVAPPVYLPTTSSVKVEVKPSTSVAPPVYLPTTTSVTKEEKPSTYVAPPSPTTYAAVPTPSTPAKSLLDKIEDKIADGFAAIKTNGNQWAMTYTPYAQDGSCKSAEAVKKDIRAIKAKGFTTVRIYATDCSGPQNVGAACAAEGMKMIIGVYIDSKGICDATHEQINTLTTWGKDKWSMVEMVVAGNEALFNGFTTASALADLITEMRQKFKAAGYKGPITTTETVAIILENASTLCPVIDVVAANIHPFFNGGFSASGAGDFVVSEMKSLSKACNGLEAYNLETGWPSAGNANGAAIPGKAEQKAAIDSIVAKAGSKSAIFSFEDDTWKAAGALGVEQFWGCSSLFAGSY